MALATAGATVVDAGSPTPAYLMAVAKRSNRTKFRDQVINPLVEEGWLEMTDPDSPRSPQQKYRLTEQGKALLEEMGKGKK